MTIVTFESWAFAVLVDRVTSSSCLITFAIMISWTMKLQVLSKSKYIKIVSWHQTSRIYLTTYLHIFIHILKTLRLSVWYLSMFSSLFTVKIYIKRYHNYNVLFTKLWNNVESSLWNTYICKNPFLCSDLKRARMRFRAEIYTI